MPTSANIVVVPCKRTQHVGPNNVACCWPTMLCPFAWALTHAKTTAIHRVVNGSYAYLEISINCSMDMSYSQFCVMFEIQISPVIVQIQHQAEANLDLPQVDSLLFLVMARCIGRIGTIKN